MPFWGCGCPYHVDCPGRLRPFDFPPSSSQSSSVIRSLMFGACSAASVALGSCPWRRPLVTMAAAEAEEAYNAVEAETTLLLTSYGLSLQTKGSIEQDAVVCFCFVLFDVHNEIVNNHNDSHKL